MKKKAALWEDNIQTGHLLEKEYWQFLYSTIIKNGITPTRTKPIKKECGETIKIIKDAGLPQSSIFRKFPLNLVHVASDYLGLGMDNLYIMQGSF